MSDQAPGEWAKSPMVGPVLVPRKAKRDYTQSNALLSQSGMTKDPNEKEYLALAAALEEKYANDLGGAQDIVQEGAQQIGPIGLSGPAGMGAAMRRGDQTLQARKARDAAMDELRRKFGKERSFQDTFNSGAAAFYGA